MDAASRRAELEPVEALSLAPGLTVGDGLQEMLAGALLALHRQDGTARPAGPDAVHRFRVGVRRLRSILSAFAEILPESERRALGARLGAAARRYGRVRDWDVFLVRTVGQLHRALPDEPALALLAERTLAARRRALPPGDRLKASIARIDAAIARAAWLRRPAPEFAATWQRPLEDYARALLETRHRKLRKQVKRVELSDQAAFHALRLRVKKLRYPAELLHSLFGERDAQAYLDRLVALQLALGQLNDALTGQTLAAALDLPVETQHLVLGALAHQAEKLRERFPDTAHAFRNATAFWS